jgi:hypothetical protein
MLLLVGLYMLVVFGMLFAINLGADSGGAPVVAQEGQANGGGDRPAPEAQGHARVNWLGMGVLLCVGPMTLGATFLVLNLIWLARRRRAGPQPTADRLGNDTTDVAPGSP